MSRNLSKKRKLNDKLQTENVNNIKRFFTSNRDRTTKFSEKSADGTGSSLLEATLSDGELRTANDEPKPSTSTANNEPKPSTSTANDKPEPSTSTTKSNDEPEPSTSTANRDPKSFTSSTPSSILKHVKREFKHEWTMNRSWLIYDPSKRAMFCRDCIKAKVDNIFTSGCTIMKKENIVKHEKTVTKSVNSHTAALKILQDSKNLQNAVLKSCSKSKDAVISAMRNVYFMAKHNLPNTLLDDLNKLCISQGATQLKSLNIDKHTTYTHHSSVKDFQKHIADVIECEILEDIRDIKLFSVTIDESTDVSVHQNMVVYIRYVKNNDPVTKFLAMRQLECTTAEHVTKELLKCFEEKGLNTAFFCGIATDGASAMVGRKSGVVTRLKSLFPSILSTHCIAHRLALASADAADSVIYLVTFQEIVNSVYKYFKQSPKNMVHLEKIQAVLSKAESSTRFKQVFHTRWLSFEGSVKAIVTNYHALVAVLSEDSSAKAAGLLKSIGNYTFVFVAHFMCDVLGHVAILCKSFQASKIDFSDVGPLLSSTVDTIEQLTGSMEGYRLNSFLKNVTITEDGHALFQDQKLKYTEGAKHKAEIVCKQFGSKLIEQLKVRFEEKNDAQILRSLCTVLSRKPMTEVVAAAETLCLHFKNTECKYWVGDLADIITEYESLTTLLTKSSSVGHTLNDVIEYVLQRHHLYPALQNIAKLLLTIPVSTVDCERGFSCQNLIKTKLRNKLQVTNLENLMKINIDGPEFEKFDFDQAHKKWAELPRRIV